MATPSPSPSEVLRDLVGRTTLKAIDIVRVHAERADMFAIGGTLTVSAGHLAVLPQIEVAFPPEQANGSLTVMVNLLAELDPSPDRESGERQAFGTVAVSARLLYSLQGAQPSAALTHQFGRELAVHHAWPFLRERVNTLAQGIGLAPALLPLRRIDAGLVD
ncbi:MAG: hypothetical protein KC549_12095 [Myxococcales bacterium]|nr:hypothetical protein [Myxococcales bacterium]